MGGRTCKISGIKIPGPSIFIGCLAELDPLKIMHDAAPQRLQEYVPNHMKKYISLGLGFSCGRHHVHVRIKSQGVPVSQWLAEHSAKRRLPSLPLW